MAAAHVTSIPPGPPSEFPSLEVRVCDLHVLSSPSGASDYFTVDGLYVILRFGSQVHRTACLWESEPLDALDAAGKEGAGQFLSFEDTTWNELFVLTFDQDDEASRKVREGQSFPTSALAAPSGGLFPPPTSVLGSLAASSSQGTSSSPTSLLAAEMRSTPPSLRTPGTSRGPAPPAIEVELWRSSADEESHIGRYRFLLPNEFGAAQSSKTLLQNGVLDKVLPLQNASAFDHRLGVRLRVRPFGVSFVPAPAAGSAGATPSSVLTTGVLGHSGRAPLYAGLYSHSSSTAGGLLGYGGVGGGSGNRHSPASILSRPSPPVLGAGLSGASSIYPMPSTASTLASTGATSLYANRGIIGLQAYTGSTTRGILGVGGGTSSQPGLWPSPQANAVGSSTAGGGNGSPVLSGGPSGPVLGSSGLHGGSFDGQGGLELPSSTSALFPSAPVQTAGAGSGAVFNAPSAGPSFGHVPPRSSNQ